MRRWIILQSSCSSAQYKARHDQVASFVHWHLCRSSGFDVVNQWWKHLPIRVLSNSSCKILYGILPSCTDRILQHNRPDIVISFPQQHKTYLIDISIPRMSLKTLEKLSKYRDLQIEVDKMWQTTSKVVPIILKEQTSAMQKSVLQSPAQILRRYLNI